MQLDHIQEAAEYIRQHIKEQPLLAIILGSGLGEYADLLKDQQIVPYTEIPHCNVSSLCKDAFTIMKATLWIKLPFRSAYWGCWGFVA